MKCTLYVMDGRVGCPRRGDTDVDECMTCTALVDVRTRQGESFIVCRPPSPALGGVPFGFL